MYKEENYEQIWTKKRKERKSSFDNFGAFGIVFDFVWKYDTKTFPRIEIRLANLSTIIAIRNSWSWNGIKVLLLESFCTSFEVGT